MKANIHPQYNENVQVVCSCGNTFYVASTKSNIRVELCSKCHPFYTGKQKFVDTASRIEKFNIKRVAKRESKLKKEEEKTSSQQPQTLREMLEALKS